MYGFENVASPAAGDFQIEIHKHSKQLQIIPFGRNISALLHPQIEHDL